MAEAVLQTERLVLRPWGPQDVSDLVEGLGELSVAQWLAFVPHPYTVEHAQAWVDRCQNLTADFEFAIELKKEGKVIGGTSLNRVDKLHGTAGGGIWLNRSYQGRGLGREAFGERVRFAFEGLGLRRLDNGYFAGNVASEAMLTSLGYKHEGIRRQAFRCMADSQIKDEHLMGLLREDWTAG